VTPGLVKRGFRMPGGLDRQALMLLAGLGLAALTRGRMATVAAMPPAPQWLTLPEASQHCGLSVGYLRRLITTGKLKAIKDRSLKVRRSDLDNLDSLSEMSESSRKLAAAAAELRELRRR
jgi:helix-turn-helix protein